MSLPHPTMSSRRPARNDLDKLLPEFDTTGRAIRQYGPWRNIDPGGDQGDREIVLAVVATLPEPYQSIYRLHDGHGVSKDELARELDLPRDVVARMLHRARCALVTLLDPHFRETRNGAPSA